jgi:hypothetical protein
MFDRAMCLPMRVAHDLYVEFAALAVLRELLGSRIRKGSVPSAAEGFGIRAGISTSPISFDGKIGQPLSRKQAAPRLGSVR